MNRLKEVRKKRNLTQEELSEIVGVERRTIGYWENGKSSIKPKQARKLAEALNTSASYLLGISDKVFQENIKVGIEDEVYLQGVVIEKIENREGVFYGVEFPNSQKVYLEEKYLTCNNLNLKGN